MGVQGMERDRQPPPDSQKQSSVALEPTLAICVHGEEVSSSSGEDSSAAVPWGDVWHCLPWNVSLVAPRKGQPGSPGPAPSDGVQVWQPPGSQEPGHHITVRLSASWGIFRVSSFSCPNLKCLDTFFLMMVPIPHVSNTHLK